MVGPESVAAEALLVVDDDAGNLVAYEAALAALGRKVVLVKSGEEALARLLDGDFALLVLDMAMPGMTGIETARMVRQRPRHRTMPILFISGRSWPQTTIAEAYDLGAFDFVQKPVWPDVLRAKVRAQLEARDRARESHTQLIAQLGHQLRNPLASMTSVLELIELRDGPLGRELAILQREVARMTAVIRGLMPGRAESTDPEGVALERIAPQATLRLLVVDDNQDAAEMLALLLRSIGHEVALAHDGLAGLDLARSFGPDVALLDLDLPELDGYELAERLRQLPSCARTELVALTAYGQATDRERTRAAGFGHHLVKPVELATLASLLAQIAQRTP